MQVGHETPNIIRFTYRQEKGDPGYGSCLWADFDFDIDEYELSIHSDCGNYGYKWWAIATGKPFLKLMAEASEEYLLKKMCRESVVDWDVTRSRIIEAINDCDITEDERETAIEELDSLAEDYDLDDSPEATTVLIERWDEENCRIDDIWEYVKTDYTGDEKRIMQIFTEHIQPVIRAYLEEGGA